MPSKKEFQENLNKIAQNFLVKLKGSIVDFEKCLKSIEKEDLPKKMQDDVLVIFHKIAGLAKIVGFEDLGKKAAQIEEILKTKVSKSKLDDLKKLLDSFIKDSHKLISANLKSESKQTLKHKDKCNYKYKILIAEDNELMRDLLREALLDIKCELIEAEDGARAIKMAKSESKNLNLVILDVNMPKKNGFEVLKALKGAGPTKDIPAIMLTRKAEDENVIKGISGGAIDYITKPFEVQDLVNIISDILKNVKKKILIADDDELIHDLLTGHFHHLGYDVVNAKDGKEAVKMIKKEKPDIAIIDYMMPALDGISVIRKVREDSELKNIPMILLTAKSQQENVLLGLKSGARDYITKPFDVDELSQRIAGILQRSEDD